MKLNSLGIINANLDTMAPLVEVANTSQDDKAAFVLKRRIITEQLLMSRYKLHLLGVDIGRERLKFLIDGGILSPSDLNAPKSAIDILKNEYGKKFKVSLNGSISSFVIDDKELKEFRMSETDIMETRFMQYHINYKGPKITRKDWCIDDPTDIPDDLYDLISSVNKGWQYRIHSDRFDKYRLHAYRLMDEYKSYETLDNDEERLQWLRTERKKCLANSLYALNMHLNIKDAKSRNGKMKYKAWTVQEFLLFLCDLGLSLLIAKLRQIGFTTTIGGRAIFRVMLSPNYYAKFVAQKGDKSAEIFEQKFKWPLTQINSAIKPTIAAYNQTDVTFSYKSGKAKNAGSESIFEVAAPAKDVINAGTPDEILLDEVGYNDLLSTIISQGRPTMFRYNPERHKLEFSRQLIGWGTGGDVTKESAAFNNEWAAAKEAWQKRDFKHGLIPIFINSFAKPGFTMEFYETEKAAYYRKRKEVGKPDPKIEFHQTWPIVEEDVFMTSLDNVVPTEIIISRMNQTALKVDSLKRGYMEPIYDTSVKYSDESYFKYKVIGARFVQANRMQEIEDSPFACITIYHDKEDGWVNRYFEGVDPIFTTSGHSKMAAVIGDRANIGRISAELNYRAKDYRFCYAQALLLGLYYSTQTKEQKLGIRQLVEENVGGEYINFCSDFGYGHTLTMRDMLPDNLRLGGSGIGIRKHGSNSMNLVNRLEDLLINYADRIDSYIFWGQCKTYVKKETATSTKYGPENKNIHFDDLIDAAVYSYINILAHQHTKMYNVNQKESVGQSKFRYRYVYEGGSVLLKKQRV